MVRRSNKPATGNRLNTVDLPDPVSDTGEQISTVEAFINNALFMVQAQNLYFDEATRPYLFQNYYKSMSWVASFIKDRNSIAVAPLTESSSDDGWYVFPPGFVCWNTLPPPVVFSKFNKNGVWIFQFASIEAFNAATSLPTLSKVSENPDDSNVYIQYISIMELRAASPMFLEAVTWHFIRSLIGTQDSVTKLAEYINGQYNYCMGILATNKSVEDRQYSKMINRRAGWAW